MNSSLISGANRPLGEVIHEIRRAEPDRHDASPSQLRLCGDRLQVQDEELLLDEIGLQVLCRSLNAPSSYLSRIPGNFRDGLLANHLLKRHGVLARYPTIRVLSRNGKLRGITNAALCQVTGTDVIDSVSTAVGPLAPTLTVTRLQVSEAEILLQLVSPQREEVVRVDDVIQAGLEVRHSFTAEFATSVVAFVYRPWCTNGMTYRQCVSRTTRRTRRLPFSSFSDACERQKRQIEDVTKEAVASLDSHLSSVAGLTEQSMTPPEIIGLWRQFLGRLRMASRATMGVVEAAWREEGAEETAYGAFNAITRAGSHENALSQRQRRALRGAAGVIANLQVHFCSQCLQPVAAS